MLEPKITVAMLDRNMLRPAVKIRMDMGSTSLERLSIRLKMPRWSR